MGLFSGKTIVSTGTSVNKMIPDKPEDMISAAVLRAILNGYNIADTLMDLFLNSNDIDIAGYLRFGENEYIHGLPEGTLEYLNVPTNSLQDVLDNIEGEPTTILTQDYVEQEFTEINGRYHLQEQRSLNSLTGEVDGTGLPDVPADAKVFIKIIRELKPGGSLEDLEELGKKEGFGLNYNYLTIGMEFVYEWYVETNPNNKNIVTEEVLTKDLDLAGGNPLNDFYQQSYYVTSDLDKRPKYWIYDITLNTYPELEGVQEQKLTSPYLPIAHIRRDKVYANSDKTSRLYEDTKELVDKIGIDLDELTDSIDENPDIKDIDDVFVLFGAALVTDDKDELNYLYEFLKKTEENQTYNEASWINNPSRRGTYLMNSLSIKDGGELDTSIRFNYIKSSIHIGTINTPGRIKQIVRNAEPNSKWPNRDYYENSTITIQKQITDTTYEEVLLHGPMHISDIYKDKVVIKTVTTSIDRYEDSKFVEGDEGFFFPVDYSILLSGKFNSLERTSIAYSTLKLVIYAIQKTKLKWYQTSAFAWLIRIVVFVIAIYTQQYQFAGAGQTFVQAALVVLENILVSFVYQLALTEIFKLVAETIGGDLALIIAAIVTIASFVYGAGIGVDGDLPFAETLMKAVTSMVDAVNTVIADDFMELQEEHADFLKSAKEKQEELEELEDMLQGNDSFNPLWAITGVSGLAIGESPDAYYNRTIHNGNPGVASLSAIESYVDNKLRLPTINQSFNFI